MEVVAIQKILAPNLLIYIYLHCVRSLLWCATTLVTLIDIDNNVNLHIGPFVKEFWCELSLASLHSDPKHFGAISYGHCSELQSDTTQEKAMYCDESDVR